MPTAVKSWKFLVEKDGKIISDYGAHRAANEWMEHRFKTLPRF